MSFPLLAGGDAIGAATLAIGCPYPPCLSGESGPLAAAAGTMVNSNGLLSVREGTFWLTVAEQGIRAASDDRRSHD
jgi:hypothetical protein